MRGLKLTSPGVLLILAVIAASSVFLVDLLHLRPLAQSMENKAIFDKGQALAGRKEEDLAGNGARLARLCRAAAVELQQGAQAGPGMASLTDTTILAITDPAGKVIQLHFAEDWQAAGGRNEVTREQVQQSLAAASAAGIGATHGLLRVDSEVAIFARCDIEQTDAAPTTLWLVKPLAAALSANVDIVVDGVRPPSRIDDGGTDLSLNPKLNENSLEIAWPAPNDAAGNSVGYFMTTTSIREIRNNAQSSRNSALLLLSLSVGAASVMFLGVHILIAGPVYRLMQRLRTIELGDDVPKDLTRDLHGEPLVLARRLESAFDKLAQMSRTDEMTGLANRRHFTNVLEAFYAQSRRYSRPLSLVVMDIDFFKAINDTGGHEAGDELLKTVADAIEDASRKADLPTRLGGDEFAILLPETSASDAEAVAERVRTTLANASVMSGSDVRVTLSIGITDLNAGEIDSPATMLSIADQALYAAKDRGRNCIVQAHTMVGMSLANGTGNEQVSKLYKKLAGLDNQFKDLFLSGVEEIIDILETRAPHMADHAHKVQRYATMLAEEMGLPRRVVKRIEIAAMLHDMGMLAMPDSLLLSTSKLTSQDMRILRQHPLISVRIMEGMEFLEQEIPAVRYHHEWFNGSGYPEGIVGTAIPLSARIITVADAFDAMTSPRLFRDAISCDQAIAELRDKSGKQFDPDVVAAFETMAQRLGDELMAQQDSPDDKPIADQQAAHPTQ